MILPARLMHHLIANVLKLTQHSKRNQTDCCNLSWQASTLVKFQRIFGGARRDRTDDLLLAKQALSQLSYGPSIRTSFVRRCSDDAPEQGVLSANVRRWSTLFYRYSRFFLLPVPYLLKTALIQINYAPFLDTKSHLPACQRHYR